MPPSFASSQVSPPHSGCLCQRHQVLKYTACSVSPQIQSDMSLYPLTRKLDILANLTFATSVNPCGPSSHSFPHCLLNFWNFLPNLPTQSTTPMLTVMKTTRVEFYLILLFLLDSAPLGSVWALHVSLSHQPSLLLFLLLLFLFSAFSLLLTSSFILLKTRGCI